MTARSIDDEPVTLSLAEAWALSYEDLRRRFWEIVVELEGTFGRNSLHEDFALYTPHMSRAAMIAATAKHEYWFNPRN